MKKNILIFTFFFTSLAIAQDKSFEYPIEKNGEESYTFQYFKKLLTDMELDSLKTSENEFHFRYLTPRHIAEIWKTKNGKLKGKLISFVERQPDSMDSKYLNNKTKKEYFIQVRQMNNKNVNQIYKKLSLWKIDEIESSTMPEGGNSNISGVLAEFSGKRSYKFKEFWIPNDQEKQSNSDKKIAEFTKLMNSLIDYDKLYKNLIDNLPKGCFNMVNGFVECNN